MSQDIDELGPVETWILYHQPGSTVQMKFTCTNDDLEIEAIVSDLKDTGCTIDDIVEVG